MKTLKQVTKELSWLGEVVSLETIGSYQVVTYINSGIRYFTGIFHNKDIRYIYYFESIDECLLYLVTKDAKLANYMLRMIEE